MGEIRNQAIRNSIISYFGAGIGFVNFIILLPFAFSPEQIGLVRLLQNTAYLVIPLAEFGIISIILRYYPIFKSDEDKRLTFILYCILGALAGFSVFCVLFFTFKGELSELFDAKSPLFVDYYYLLLPLVFLIVFTGIFEAISNSIYKTVFPNFLREVLLRILIAILVIAYVYNIVQFNSFVNLFVLIYIFPLLFLLAYLIKKDEISINFSLQKFPKPIFKEIGLYGIFVLLGSSGHLLVSYIDTVMLGILLGLEDTGIYVTAFYMAVIIEIPRRSLRQIAVPFLSDAWKRNDLKQINEIYEKTSLNQLIIGLYIFLGVWINIDAVFELMPNGAIYSAGKFVVFYVMLGKLIDMAAGVNGEIIALSKWYRFNMYSTLILALLAIITNYLLIPLYGLTGAAIATALSLLFYNVLKYLFLKIKLNLNPFSLNTIRVLLLGGICYLIMTLIPEISSPILSILSKSLLLTLIFIFPLYYLKISEDVNQFINNVLSGIKAYFNT